LPWRCSFGAVDAGASFLWVPRFSLLVPAITMDIAINTTMLLRGTEGAGMAMVVAIATAAAGSAGTEWWCLVLPRHVALH
jgi:hypothetical protein